MNGSSLDRRRLLSLLATGTATVLAGCSRLFTDPDEDTATPTSTPTPATTPTPTPATTPTLTPEAEMTPTPTNGVVPLRITGYDIAFEEVVGEFTGADVLVGVENVGDRRIDLVELRVAMVFAPDAEDRTVAVDFVGSGFDESVAVGAGFDDVTGDSGARDGDDRGLSPSETGLIPYRTRFPSDGRANASTDPDDFALRFRVTRVEYA